MNEKREDNGTVSFVASIPDGVCHMCMQPKELMMFQVSYPGSWSQSKICLDCKDTLCLAISKALQSVRW